MASGTQEISTGNYTIMTELVAGILGVPPSLIGARLGDAPFPGALISAGSMSTASVLPAVKAAVERVRQKLTNLSGGTAEFRDGMFGGESVAKLLQRNGNQRVEALATTKPQLDPKDAPLHSFRAVFAEVGVDAGFGAVCETCGGCLRCRANHQSQNGRHRGVSR